MTLLCNNYKSIWQYYSMYTQANEQEFSTNSKASAHEAIAKRSYDILRDKYNKLIHRNPYSNKVISRMIPSKKQQMNLMKQEVQAFLSNVQNLDTSNASVELKSKYIALLNDLKQYDQPEETIDQQLSDLKQNSNAMGIMDPRFHWDIDMNQTYINSFTLLLGASKSGKSFLINSLIFELPQSFDKIIFFMPLQSWKNTAPKVLEHIAKKAGMKTQWVNTDIEGLDPEQMYSEDLETCLNDLNDDGSAKYIYSCPAYGSVYIMDDLQCCVNPNIINFIDNLAVRARHSKINVFYSLQSFTRLSSRVLDNVTKVFINRNFIEREDLWRKLRIAPPENLSGVLKDVHNGFAQRWYYINDSYLEAYIPYDFANQQQVVRKMQGKLPKNIRNIKIKSEFETKSKELETMAKQLGIQGNAQQILMGSTLQNNVESKTEGKVIRLTDPSQAIKIDQKVYNAESTTHDKSKYANAKNLRAKYRI